MTEHLLRVALYIRVSTEEQVKTGYSIPDQRRALRDHAEREGYVVVEEIIDDGLSGADPFRPGIRRVLELAEAGKIDAALATKRDRFFRSRLYRLEMDRDLQDHGARLIALNDTGHRIGDGVQDDYAEWEREVFAERSRTGKMEKARGGKVVAGSPAPYGYRYNEPKTGFVVHGPEMANVARVMRLMASGTTLYGVRKVL